MTAARRFIDWGSKVFAPNTYHRVPFQPLIYAFLWSATVRVVFFGHTIPIPFEKIGGSWVYTAWLAINLIAPPVALWSWWLITRSRWFFASLVGTWVRLIADMMMFAGLLAYHLARIAVPGVDHDTTVYSRYLTGSILAFILLLVVRDVWVIMLTERVGQRIENEKAASDGGN